MQTLSAFTSSAYYPPALLLFSLAWFYFPTKLLYPKLGLLWEVVVAMPVLAAAIAGTALCFTHTNPVLQALAVAYLVLLFAFWQRKVKTRLSTL